MGRRELTADEISDLSPEVYRNLIDLLGNFESKELKIRLAILEKISTDFLPERFQSEYYPVQPVKAVFVKALESDNVDEVTEALSGLTYIDQSLARTYSRKLLKHPDLRVEEESVDCLGYVGDSDDINTLYNILTTEGNDVLKASAYASLLRLGEASLFAKVEDIIDAVNDEALKNLLEAFCTLVDRYDFSNILNKLVERVASSGSPLLGAELDDLKNIIDRDRSLNKLDDLDPWNKDDMDLILSFFDHGNIDVRFKALNLFGADSKPNKRVLPRQMPNKYVLEKIKELIHDSSDEVRSEVLSILGDWKDSESILLIGECLNDDSELVRLDAIYALGEIGEKEALDELKRFKFREGSDLEKVRYLQARIRLGDESFFEEWLSYLYHDDAMVRANVAGGIWSIWKMKWNSQIEKHIQDVLRNEPFVYVYNELNDALEFISTRRIEGGFDL